MTRSTIYFSIMKIVLYLTLAITLATGLIISTVDTKVTAEEQIIYVDNAWAGSDNGDVVGDGYIFGQNAFASIGQAVQGTSAGGSVMVAAGTYNLSSPIMIDRALTITGDTDNPETVLINAPTSGDDREVFQVLADNVTIQGFTVQGSKDVQKGSSWNSNPGIAVGGDKLMLENKPDGATEYSFNYWGFAVSNIDILNNIITDNSYGIFLFHAQDVVIEGNIIHGNTRDANTWSGKGIAIYTSKDMADPTKVTVGTVLPHTNNITINNNQIYENALFGIELNHAEAYHGGVGGPFNVDIKITNNTIYDNGGPMDAVGQAYDFSRGITSNSNETNVTITGNTIYGHVATPGARYQSSCAGIRIPFASGWTIQDNVIYGNTFGIYAYAGSTDITIDSGSLGPNIIYNNAQGVVMSDGTVGTINGNMIYDNDVDTWEISNNVVPAGVVNQGTTDLDAMRNWWGDESGPTHVTNPTGSGDVVTDNVLFDPWYTNEALTATGSNDPIHNETQDTWHPTIQAAIDAANAGDILVVTGGTYDPSSEGRPLGDSTKGLINVTKGVTIRAATGERPILDGSGIDGVIKIHPAALTPGSVVIIEGFEITGIPTTGIAITMQGCFDITPAQVIIRDNWFHGIIGGIDFWGAGAYLPSGWTSAITNVEITGNKFYELGVAGVQQGFGVMLEDMADWATAGNQHAVLVQDNEFYDIFDGGGSDFGVGIIIPRANDAHEAANVNIIGNSFNNLGIGIVILDLNETGVNLDITTTVIHENSITGITGYGLMVSDITNGPVDAQQNWWGTADGSTISNLISGDVSYLPWYTTADMDTLTMSITEIPGVTTPVTGVTPINMITETDQFTGTVIWSQSTTPFLGETIYTATITLTPKTGYSFNGVAEDFFIVPGAGSVSNPADSGIVTAIFPATDPAALVSILVTPSGISVNAGSTVQMSATGNYSDNTTANLTEEVIWVSSNTPVANINNTNAKGRVSTSNTGITFITALLGGVTSNQAVISVNDPTLTGIRITGNSTAAVGVPTGPLGVIGYYSNGTEQAVTLDITWTSQTPTIATVDGSGMVTGLLMDRNAVITATVQGLTANHTVAITAPILTEITVIPDNPVVDYAGTFVFSIIGTYSDGSSNEITTGVSWTSSTHTTATINSATGTVTTLAPGTTTITATIGGLSTSLTLTVSELAKQTIPVTDNTADIQIFVSDEGTFSAEVELIADDESIILGMPAGTVGLSSTHEPINSISMVPVAELPALPEGTNIIGLAWNLGPDGATFEPAINLSMPYDPSKLPEGVAEEDLVIAWYDTSANAWVMLETTVDTVNKVLTAKVSHFTTFALMGIETEEPAPTVPTTTTTTSANHTVNPTIWWILGIGAVLVLAVLLLVKQKNS